MTLTPDAREAKALRKALKELAGSVEAFIFLLDGLMKQPSTVERGEKVAALLNKLELENDMAKHFGLGLPLGKRLNK